MVSKTAAADSRESSNYTALISYTPLVVMILQSASHIFHTNPMYSALYIFIKTIGVDINGNNL